MAPQSRPPAEGPPSSPQRLPQCFQLPTSNFQLPQKSETRRCERRVSSSGKGLSPIGPQPCGGDHRDKSRRLTRLGMVHQVMRPQSVKSPYFLAVFLAGFLAAVFLAAGFLAVAFLVAVLAIIYHPLSAIEKVHAC